MTKSLASSNHLPWTGYYICMGGRLDDLDNTPWAEGTAMAFLWANVFVMVTYMVIKRRWQGV